MGAKFILNCDICQKEQVFVGAYAMDNIKPWQAMPDRKKNPDGPWENKYGKFDHLAYEWTCSITCMEKWIDQDPENRVIFIPNKDYYGDDNPIPCCVVKRTKKHVWLSLYNAQFDLKTGDWTGEGGFHGRCCGKLREEDRVRFIKNNF